MAHISGLVAAGITTTNPFDHSHIVTTTTHKTLRGPRYAAVPVRPARNMERASERASTGTHRAFCSGGMIFYRKGPVTVGGDVVNLEEQINWAVFPALQGGPHDHQIAAVAVALKEAMTPEFVAYQRQVLANAKCLAESLMALGYHIVSNGTSNHLMLVDLNPKKIDGARAELVMDQSHITVNKNTVPGDTKPLVPGGLRLGTPALTTRGMREPELRQIAQFLDRGFKITIDVNSQDRTFAGRVRRHCILARTHARTHSLTLPRPQRATPRVSRTLPLL